MRQGHGQAIYGKDRDPEDGDIGAMRCGRAKARTFVTGPSH